MCSSTYNLRRRLAAVWMLLVLSGCSSDPGQDVQPAAANPTTCVIDHDGSPITPDDLTVTCGAAKFDLPGPWVDGERRNPDLATGGLDLRAATIVGGVAQVVLIDALGTVSCVVTRELILEDTSVRCHDLHPRHRRTPASA